MQTGRGTATHQRRLHDGRTFWSATPRITVPSVRSPAARSYAVIVVGAGISGALVAEALSRRFRRLLVVDRRAPATGSTRASTAMILHEIDVPLAELQRRIGTDRARRAWQRSARAVADLTQLVQRLQIDCGIERRQSLYLTGDSHGARALEAEAALRRAAGLGAEWLGAAALRERFGIERTGAIVSDISVAATPAQMAAGLLRVAAARGAEIVAPLEISDVAEAGDAVVLATRDGRILTAGRAVFCTGYEFLPQMQSPAHRVISTWALASRTGIARPDWLDRFVIWEASDPYLYLRSATGGRIIAGGEDEAGASDFRDAARRQAKARRIAAKLRDLLGLVIGRPAYVWGAPFGTTADGLPVIDLVPGMRRVHAVMGFGGNGITFSKIAAEMLAAEVAGEPDPDADLFRFR